jgi:hypothetical protein
MILGPTPTQSLAPTGMIFGPTPTQPLAPTGMILHLHQLSLLPLRHESWANANATSCPYGHDFTPTPKQPLAPTSMIPAPTNYSFRRQRYTLPVPSTCQDYIPHEWLEKRTIPLSTWRHEATTTTSPCMWAAGLSISYIQFW